MVLRVVPEAATGGMTSLTDQDLRPFLDQASIPVHSEGFAAGRALVLHGKALKSANLTELVAAAGAGGGCPVSPTGQRGRAGAPASQILMPNAVQLSAPSTATQAA